MISIERDSSGRTFQVWKQNQMNSCGIACVWMAKSIARQMSFAEDEWELAVRTFGSAVGVALARIGAQASGPMTLNPAAFSNDQSSMASSLANFGFYAGQIANILRGERLHVEHTGFDGKAHSIHSHKIAYNKPAIALVAWNGGGGHFIVVGRATRHALSILDPWNGHINEQGNNGHYIAPYGGRGSICEILYVSA